MLHFYHLESDRMSEPVHLCVFCKILSWMLFFPFKRCLALLHGYFWSFPTTWHLPVCEQTVLELCLPFLANGFSSFPFTLCDVHTALSLIVLIIGVFDLKWGRQRHHWFVSHAEQQTEALECLVNCFTRKNDEHSTESHTFKAMFTHLGKSQVAHAIISERIDWGQDPLLISCCTSVLLLNERALLLSCYLHMLMVSSLWHLSHVWNSLSETSPIR